MIKELKYLIHQVDTMFIVINSVCSLFKEKYYHKEDKAQGTLEVEGRKTNNKRPRRLHRNAGLTSPQLPPNLGVIEEG